MTPNDPGAAERSRTFWLRSRRVLQVALALAVALAVFTLTRNSDDGAVPALPDTTTQFSLDLKVIGSASGDTIYAVEQRARPAYRIFAFNPETGEDTTVFTVPEDAIIYGIALSSDRETLAVSYSPDFSVEGSGIWTLDLDTLDFTQIVAVEAGTYLTEPEFNDSDTAVFVTHVDRSGEVEQLSLAEVVLATGESAIVVQNAITPALVGDQLYYLTVDEQNARRSIGVRDANGNIEVIAVGDGELDLDHLSADSSGSIRVAVLEDTSEPAITVGEPAGAHGNHNVKSTWWSLTGDGPRATDIEPIIVYDAAVTNDGTIVYATLEGLSVATNERTDLIASRAIRFIAG